MFVTRAPSSAETRQPSASGDETRHCTTHNDPAQQPSDTRYTSSVLFSGWKYIHKPLLVVLRMTNIARITGITISRKTSSGLFQSELLRDQ